MSGAGPDPVSVAHLSSPPLLPDLASDLAGGVGNSGEDAIPGHDVWAPLLSGGNLAMTTPGGRMADYIATAIREGDNWVIDVDGVGTTHSDSLDNVEAMAVDLVIAQTHTAPDDVHVQVRIV